MRQGRSWLLGAAVVVFAAVAVALWASDRPGQPVADVDVELTLAATVDDVSLAAAGATADLGVEKGLRRVNIRIVDTFSIEVSIESERDMVLSAPPFACLVGPFWNPLDAGLSDRCWGDPDLGAVLAEHLPRDDQGQLGLPGGEPFVVRVNLQRGDKRCDYSPGEWHLEFTASRVIDGSGVAPVVLPDLTVYVPYENPVSNGSPGTLALLPTDQTRICSYPAAVYLRQGDPPVSSPQPIASESSLPSESSHAGGRCAITPNANPAAIMALSGFQFGEEVSIPVGGAVAFENQDPVMHTVSEGTTDTISADACINERIAPGETLVITFTEAGDYDITCTLHAAMHTVIHVE